MPTTSRPAQLLEAREKTGLPIDFLEIITRGLGGAGTAQVLKNCEALPAKIREVAMSPIWNDDNG